MRFFIRTTVLLNEIYSKKITGEGPLNFILIHNAGGCHKMFTYQVKMLLIYGNVVLLDLPGHGSSAPYNQNSINHSSELIHEICKYYALDNIWLIGLNNGANIAINTVHMGQIKPCGMVLIDPLLSLNNDSIKEINIFIKKINSPSYEEFINLLVEDLLANSNQINKEIALNSFMKVDKKCLKEMFQSLINSNKFSESIFSSIDISTLCILTNEHHCTFDTIKKIAPKFILGKVIESKCWATLEVPEQVNAMIERFLVVQNNTQI